MSVTIVNEWFFKEDGDIDEGLAAAADYVAYMKTNNPGLELSLWLQDHNNPLHFFHVSVFASQEVAERERKSEGTKRFTDRLYPEIHLDETFTQPECDVVLSSGAQLESVSL
jgi:quinol monooxygenase YgiN